MGKDTYNETDPYFEKDAQAQNGFAMVNFTQKLSRFDNLLIGRYFYRKNHGFFFSNYNIATNCIGWDILVILFNVLVYSSQKYSPSWLVFAIIPSWRNASLSDMTIYFCILLWYWQNKEHRGQTLAWFTVKMLCVYWRLPFVGLNEDFI